MKDFAWGPLLSEGPLFIGILNVTPDSFSDGGRFQSAEAALAQARKLVEAGAGMLDLGAESTRPGAEEVSSEEEWRRLEPVLTGLRAEFPAIPLSLDSRHPQVARKGLEAGVAVLNDVTGFTEPTLLDLAQNASCGLIAMRSRSVQGRLWMPDYGGPAAGDSQAELRALRDRLTLEGGIAAERILLDPGFGFGTTFQGDLALWEGLGTLPGDLAWPSDRFCLGLSRKRFLAWRAGTPELPPAQRDALTAAAQHEARRWGYRIFRTHAI